MRLILYLLIGVVIGCSKNRNEKVFLGMWTIEKIEINNVDYQLTRLGVNVIVFKDEERCRIPFEKGVDNLGKWSVTAKEIFLESDKSFLKGRYCYSFVKNDNTGINKIKLEGENGIVLICSKVKLFQH